MATPIHAEPGGRTIRPDRPLRDHAKLLPYLAERTAHQQTTDNSEPFDFAQNLP